MHGVVRLAIGLVVLVGLLPTSGCGPFQQTQDPATVLIRQPGNRTYDPAVPIASSAAELWEYAVLSDDVYAERPDGPPPAPSDEEREPPPPTADAWQRACTAPNTAQLPLPGWRRWRDFPSPTVKAKAQKLGLYVEVWQRTNRKDEVVVAFQGTNAWNDWIANFRWFFWFLRFIPTFEDHYTVVAKDVAREFLTRFPAETGGRDGVTVATTGHSLGGGLATYFAYALPADGRVPRVSSVYGFDPSPVTGWSAVDASLRTQNVQGLAISRTFEHGEILAYFRLVLRYVNPPPAVNPSIREVRYNFIVSANVLRSHSMRLIACALAGASHETPLPEDTGVRMQRSAP